MCECIDWLLEAEMNNIMQFAAHWYILSTQKLPARKCKECGKKLSWNYRYGICNACYNARRMSYENGWYDSWY